LTPLLTPFLPVVTPLLTPFLPVVTPFHAGCLSLRI